MAVIGCVSRAAVDLLRNRSGGRIVACEEDRSPGSGALTKKLSDIAKPFSKLPCTRPQLHGLRGGIAFCDLEHAHERTVNVKLMSVACLGRRKPINRGARLPIGILRLLKRAPRKRRLPRSDPGGDRQLYFASLGPMPGKELRMRRSPHRKLFTHCARHAAMELAALAL